MLLLHHVLWWTGLGFTNLARSSAAADTAAQDGEEKETADATGDADDKFAVVVNPGANFFCYG